MLPSLDENTFSREREEREHSKRAQQAPLTTQSRPLRHYRLGTVPLSIGILGLREDDVRRPLPNTHEPTLRGNRLDTALAELSEIDEEVAEEHLPEIHPGTKENARRIISALANESVAPTVYPTEDGEIALYFKSPVAKSAVLILVGNDGQGACFSYINGKNRRARYDDASELPDIFVRAQLLQLVNA